MTTYWEQLRDPRWQRKRLEVMERADFTCEQCESTTTTLNVHHRYYVKGRKPWEYEDEALACLCEKCHKSTTDILGEIARRAGMLSSGDLEEVLGYLQAASYLAGQDDSETIRVGSYEHAVGVCHGFSIISRVAIESVIALAQANGGAVDPSDLIAIAIKQMRVVTAHHSDSDA